MMQEKNKSKIKFAALSPRSLEFLMADIDWDLKEYMSQYEIVKRHRDRIEGEQKMLK